MSAIVDVDGGTRYVSGDFPMLIRSFAEGGAWDAPTGTKEWSMCGRWRRYKWWCYTTMKLELWWAHGETYSWFGGRRADG